MHIISFDEIQNELKEIISDKNSLHKAYQAVQSKTDLNLDKVLKALRKK